MSRNLFRGVVKWLVLLGVIGLSGVEAGAIVYDLASDFTVSANPNGAWTYGFSNPSFSAYTLAQVDANYFGSGEAAWAPSDNGFPSIWKNENGGWGFGQDMPLDTVGFNYNSANSVGVVWTAPFAGTFDIIGDTWTIVENTPVSRITLLIAGSPVISNAEVTDASSSAAPLTLASLAGNPNDLLDVALGAGQTIEVRFGLLAGTTIEADNVGLRLSITQQAVIPEPGSLILVAIGGTALIVRHRRGLFFRRRSA